jgi:V8-like Glu-specific endopeptidase
MIDEQGTFITANHLIAVFATSPWKDVCMAAITFPVGGWKRTPQDVRWYRFGLAKCQVNEGWDVAVCKTEDDMSKQTAVSYEVVRISAERPPDGTMVFFTGFPLQADDPITSIGSVAGFTASDGYNSIIIDKNAWPGASGSPIYLPNGQDIIGMIEKTGTGDAAGISFGVASERLVNILTSAKANWTKEENKQPKKP